MRTTAYIATFARLYSRVCCDNEIALHDKLELPIIELNTFDEMELL